MDCQLGHPAVLDDTAAANAAMSRSGSGERDSTLTTLTTDQYTSASGTRGSTSFNGLNTWIRGDGQDSGFLVPVLGRWYISVHFCSGEVDSGRTIYLTYLGPHTKLTAYNSQISETPSRTGG